VAGVESREIRLEQVRALAGRLRKLERSRVHMLSRTRDGLIDEGAQRGHAERVVSTGCRSLDEVLMDGGLRRGTLVEWINGAGRGSGAVTLALLAMKGCHARGWLVVVDTRGDFYPAAAAGLGIGPERVLIVRPRDRREWLWSVEQVLRSPAIAGMLTWAERLDDRTFRRWQLAGEVGGGVGMLVRPERARREPSWAAARLEVTPLVSEQIDERPPGGQPESGRRWSVRVVRSRGNQAIAGDGVQLELNDETGCLHLLSELDRTAVAGCPAVG